MARLDLRQIISKEGGGRVAYQNKPDASVLQSYPEVGLSHALDGVLQLCVGYEWPSMNHCTAGTLDRSIADGYQPELAQSAAKLLTLFPCQTPMSIDRPVGYRQADKGRCGGRVVF